MRPEDDIGIEVNLRVPHPSGGQSVKLSVDDIALFQKDRVALAAKCFGIDKQHFQLWAEFIKNPQCQASTRSGRRCLNSVDTSDLDKPDRFNPSETYFCRVHHEFTERPSVYSKK